MKTFNILHCTGPQAFTAEENQPRDYVGTVQANSLEGAVKASMNGDDNWGGNYPKRSTTIGDVIQDVERGEFHMYLGWGFKRLY